MKGIILAAGRGSRMGDLTNKLPKCRTVLHGKELLSWQIDSLKNAGINEIAIVRGYLSDTFDLNMKYFDNLRWHETNMVASLLAAKEWLKSDVCITSYSDIVYSAEAVKRLIHSSGDIAITYDPNWFRLWAMRFNDPLIDAETFSIEDGIVTEIGNRAKSISDIEGQYMGLVKYTPKGWNHVVKYLSSFSSDELDKLDMTKLLQGLIQSGVEVHGVAIDDAWFEVDTENDLDVYHLNYSDSPLS